ncbi:abnormal spindle-like microcephaly-associated protein homolog [Glandiceps talaboti]
MAAALSPFSGASSVGSPRGAWFSRTPYRNRSPRKEREETPKLQLTYFAGKTILSFNKVKVGKSKTCKLHVRNPHDFELELFLEKFPFKKGFSVADDTTNWLLQGEEQTTIKFLWTPTEAGNIRELVTFKFDGAHRLQIILLGTGVASPIKKVSKKRSKWNTKKSGISDLRNKCLQNRNYRPPMKTTTMSKSQAKSGSPVISQFDAENVRPAEITENRQDEIPVEMDTIPITPRSMKRSRTFELLNASLDTTPVIDVDSPSPLKATSKFEARFPLKESQAFNISLSPDRGRLCTKDFGDISISPEATSNDANDALLQSRLTFCVGKNQTPSIPTRLSSSPKDGVPFPLEDNLEIQPISHEAEFGSLKSDDIHNLPTEKDSTVATLGSIAEEQSISHILSDIKESSLIEKNSLVITPVVLEETPANLTANIETPVFPDMVSDTSLRRHSSTPLTSKGKTQQVHKEIRSSLASYNNTKTNGVNEETKKPGDSLFKKPQLPVKHRQTKPQNEPEQRRRSLTGRRRSLVSQTVTKVQPTFPTESNIYPPDVEARRLTTVIGTKTAAPSSLTGRRQSLNSQTVTKSQAPMQKKSTDESEHHEPEARRLSTATVTKDSTSRRLSTATVTKAPEQRRLSTATVTKNQDTRRLSTATVTKDPELRRLSTATVTKDPELRRLSTATVTKDPESRRLSTATVTKNTETRRLSTATVLKDQEVKPQPVTDIDQQKSENGVVCKELFPAESASVDRKRKLDDDASTVSEQDSLMLMSMNDIDITEQDNTIASVTSHDIFPIHNSIITSKPKRAKTKSGPIVSRKPTTKGKTGTYATSKPVRGVAMARLALRKTTKRSIPSHPNLYAAQNMFYDERWTEKQERGFTKWLNHILTPDEMDCPQDPKCKNAKIDAGTICVVNHEDITLAPTKEELSLKTYTAIRRLNKLRKAACRLFESEPNIRVVKRLEEEIERGRLRVRPDKHINRDYGVRQQLLEMIMSFNPLWLRIGLETIYGVVLHLRSNLDVHGLSRFVVSRLLNDPTIAAEYAHPNVIHLYRDGYEEALAKFTLKKFLLLVFFLDRAKLTKLIDLDPCLFCKDAEIKSSRGLLLQFSRDYLSGEGDVTRHLSYFGYTVSHVQTALHEFDYAVANIRVDLRSGIRVVKIMELLTGNWQLSTQLRMPAISRLQKLHNMEVALKAMKEAGIDVQTGGIDNKTIVDGHKEKTLELLWRLIFHFQINVRLNAEKVKEETAFLRKNLILQKKLAAVALLDTVQPKDEERRTSDPGLYFKSERLNLLLQWCKAVCAYYGMKIENFTVSFSDGRALCYLIHHYHPSLLPSSEIKLDTTQSHHEKEEEADDVDETDSNQNPDGTWTKTCIPSTGKPTSYEERLTNEKHNFKCLYDAVAQLGGVPVMIKSTDMSNTIPNEKVVITYLSYLCERLLDLREETRAARIIQATWRRHKLKKVTKETQRAEKQAQKMKEYIVKLQSVVRGHLVRRNLSRMRDAVHKIQQFYRAYRQGQKPREEFKRKKVAVVKIQSGFRGMLARKEARRERAALCLQARWKGYNKRVQYQKLRTATINMQALVRGRQARTRCEKMRLEKIAIEQERQQKMQACVTIQKFYRGYQARSSFLATRNAVIKMQAVAKCAMALRKYNKLKWATRTIQSHFRAQKVYQRENRQYNKVKGACLTIQAFWKGYQARKLAHKHRAARQIQATYRMYTQRKEFLKLKKAAVTLQSLVRKLQAQRRYHKVKCATSIIQGRWRATLSARQQKRDFLRFKGTTILAQSLYRGRLARKHLQKIKAAIKIQTTYRRFSAAKKYQYLRQVVVMLQSGIRMYQARKTYTCVKASAVTLQAHWRAYLMREKEVQSYQRMRGSVIKIQSYYRMYRAEKSYNELKEATIRLQALVRKTLVQKRYQNLKHAVVSMQRYYRANKLCKIEQQRYQKLKMATITVQAFYRGCQARKYVKREKSARLVVSVLKMYLARKKYIGQKAAAVTIQANVRAYQARQRFLQVKTAVLVIQQRYRASVVAHSAYVKYQKTIKATILIQSVFRGYRARNSFLATRNAVITIQAFIKGAMAQRKYNKLKWATRTIQSHYRAQKVYQRENRQYNKVKGACLTIQAFWKGYQARKLAHKHRAARQIQATYKMYTASQKYKNLKTATIRLQALVKGYQKRQEYQQLKEATVILQCRYRATMMARQQRKEFLKLKGTAILAQCLYRGRLARKHLQKIKAAIRIQSTYRRFSAAKKYQHLRQAVVMLQSDIRMYQARKTYNCLKESAVTLQAHWRAYLMREKEVQSYQRMRWSVIKIQSYYRMYRAEKSYKELKEATIRLQALVRKTLVQKRYQNLKHAVVSMQRYYRANKLCKIEQQRYQKLKMATVTVQAFYRGCQARKFVKRGKSARLVVSVLKMYLARKKYIRQKAAAVKIQTNVRAYQSRQRFLQLKKAATVLQERYRASVAAHSAYVKYQKTRKATILIQSSFRGYQTRSSFLATRNAVIKMQALVKGAMALRRYNKLKWATRTIQSHYRAQKVYQRENRQYNKLKGACLTIQAFWKGYQARKLAHKHRAARQIQATYRMYTASQKYKKLKTATIRLQALVKGYQKRQEYQQLKEATAVLQCRYRATMMARQQRKEFLKLKGVTILAQSLFRGHLARQYFHKILAARKIQTYYRGYVACRNYQQMRKGAIVIQSNFRKFNATQRYQKLRHAAVVLQVHFRAYTLKQQAVDEYQNLKKSTIKIQSLWRGYIIQNEYKRLRRTAVTLQSLVRKQQAQRRYHKMKHATNIIQERWRATLAARQQRLDFLRFKGTTILAQSLYRGRLARKHLQKIKAAIRIQTTYRRFSAAKKYQHLRQAVIMLQSSIRMYQARKTYNCLKESAVTLQAYWRAYLMREKEVQSYQRMRWSVIKIQSYYRMYRAEKSYKELKEATIRLQAVVRKTLAQKRYQNLKHAVVSIQRYYRANKLCKIEQERYQKLKMASITIQAFYRGCQARKFVKQEKSARLVVSVLKMYLARKKYIGQKAAAVKIQTNVRAYQARQRFLQLKKAATVLQKRYRASVAGKRARQHFIEMKEATLLVQRIYRGQLARSYVKQIKAAVTIQTAYRAHSAYVKYQKIRKAVILIQAAVRNHLAEKQVREERLKRFTAALYHHICAMKIQRYYRNAKAMELAKERLHSVISIQRWVRAKLERQRFKKLRRGIILLQRLVRHQQVKCHQAATKIQAAARMYLAKIDAEKRKKAIQTLQALWRGRQVRTSIKSKKLKMIRGRLQEANKNATEQMKLCNRVSTALDFLLHTRMMSHLLTSLESLEVATRLSPKCCERIAANNAVHTVYELIRSCNRSLPHMQAISFCISILLNLAKYENTVYAVYEVPDSVSTLVDLMQIYRGKGCSIFTKSCTLLVVICRDRRRSQEILQITKTVEKIRSIHLLSTRQEKLKQQRIKANLSKSLNNFLSTTLDTTMSRQPQIQPEWVLHREKITEICDPIEAITAVMSTLKLKGK